MAQHQPEKIGDKTVEKVGVILVHGIGEQRRFEFLEGTRARLSMPLSLTTASPAVW